MAGGKCARFEASSRVALFGIRAVTVEVAFVVQAEGLAARRGATGVPIDPVDVLFKTAYAIFI
jgi:hypothetical protein